MGWNINKESIQHALFMIPHIQRINPSTFGASYSILINYFFIDQHFSATGYARNGMHPAVLFDIIFEMP